MTSWKVLLPTAKLLSISMFLALSTLFSCKIAQLDVNSAYIIADLGEDGCVEQPTEIEIPGKGSKIVCKLSKTFRGLKQALRCVNRTLDNFLIFFGLTG